MLLTNILISDDPGDTDRLPEIIRENIESFRRFHPDLEYRLYNRDMIRELLQNCFGREILWAFDNLKPFAFQADLARYCILYEFGGIYSDLACHFLRSMPMQPGKLSVFTDWGYASPWDTYNGLIAVPPKHKALLRAIELTYANIKSNYYGSHPLCPTGPTVFGKAVALTCQPEEILAGRSTRVKVDQWGDAYWHALCQGDDVVAIRRKQTIGLLDLGITTGNNYNTMWGSGNVYHSQP